MSANDKWLARKADPKYRAEMDRKTKTWCNPRNKKG